MNIHHFWAPHADTAAASSAELQVYLNAVTNGLDRIARGAIDPQHIAEHCQRNLALALQILAVGLEGRAAERKGTH